MIEGFVNANLEAVVTLPVRGPAGRTQSGAEPNSAVADR